MISLYVSSGKAYVWSVEDIECLRIQHHICGTLVGTLPHLSQQNVFLGLPLILMPEEVVLLVQEGLAVLVDDRASHHHVSEADLTQWNKQQKGVYAQDITPMPPLHDTPKNILTEAELEKRRARKEKRTNKALSNTALLASGGITFEPDTLSVGKEVRQPKTVIVPRTSSSFTWHDPSAHTYTSVDAAITAGIWFFPSSLRERARCDVFRDLWKQGLYMGIGIKFGGDYLVYPGDPLRYHSHFVATIFIHGEEEEEAINPMEIVAHGRLGTATRKSHLFCGWNQHNGSIEYFSIEWSGFG